MIESAIKLKDEISPYLVRILENVLRDPEKYIENKKLVDHFYSIMILGHFREPKAHKEKLLRLVEMLHVHVGAGRNIKSVV